jgi:hypothetical protein
VAFFAAALAALAVCGSAAATPDCASRLLADWRDGRMDRVYPVDCYREALGSLPEDLRIYSSAESDITRALQARVRTEGVAKAAAPKTDGGHGGVSPFVILAVTAGLVLGVGSLVVYAR